MTWDHGVRLIDSLIWPLVIILSLFVFGPALRRFLNDVKEFSFKGGGLEASATRETIKAAAAVGVAVGRQKKDSENPSPIRDVPEITPLIEKATAPRPRRRLSRATVLWVDDRPSNNVYERRALEALGLHIELANDTDDALQKLASKHFDLVISDMGRPSSKQAGFELLRAVRDRGANMPFVIYAGSNAPEHRAEAKRRGAQGTTNDPSELFELVLDHILT
jgi:CheY-like chemotaxis protein